MTSRRGIAALACVAALSGVAACTSDAAKQEAATTVATSPSVSAMSSMPSAPLTPNNPTGSLAEPTMTVPTGGADTSSLPVSGAALPANGAAVDAETFAAAMLVPGTVILDVRTPQEFAEGHIEGAFNIDIESGNFADKVAELDTRVPYVIYCRSGNRSAVAVEQMKSIGFTQTYHLEGGIAAWQSSGHPVVK